MQTTYKESNKEREREGLWAYKSNQRQAAAKDATGRKKRRVCKRPVSGSLIRRYKLQAAEGMGYV
jgi:hypothetical protein